MSDQEWYHFACWFKLTPEQFGKMRDDPDVFLAALRDGVGGEITVDNVFLGHEKPEPPHVRLGTTGRFFNKGWEVK